MSEVVIGEIGKDGSPYIDLLLYGVLERDRGLPLKGVVDTGFTGFLLINLLEACKINLPLQGIGSATLADGTVVRTIQAMGLVRLAGDPEEETVPGIVHLSEESEDVLVGMEFLRESHRGLKVFRDRVLLVPDPPQES